MSEMLSRTRCAPRLGQRTWPRFILLLSSIACLLLTVEGFTTEWLMRNAFSDFLDKEVKKAFGGRMDALTGTKSLYQLLQEENARRGGDTFSLIKMAAKELGPNDAGVQAILAAERKVRGADRALAFLALSGAITFFLLSFVVYGAGNSRFSTANWVYGLFNGHEDTENMLHEDEQGPAVPDLLSQIVIDWAINSANVSDSLFFEIDVHVLAELCAISGKPADSRLREEFAKRLCRLCHVPSKLRLNRGDWSLNWEGIALVPAKGVDPGEAGAYRLETNLTSSVKGHLLSRQLPRESYAVPLLCGPVVYELWKAMWDVRTESSDKGVQVGEAKCTLLRLLEDSAIRFDKENQHASLDRLHRGLDSLRSHGFIEGWTITEGGRASPASWYERVKLFHYDKEQCAYRLDRKLLERKTYRFWCGGTTTPLPPPKPIVLKKKKKKKKKPSKGKPAVKVPDLQSEPSPEPVIFIDEPEPAVEATPDPIVNSVQEVRTVKKVKQRRPKRKVKAKPAVQEEPILVIDDEPEREERVAVINEAETEKQEPAPLPEEKQRYITLSDDSVTCNDESELIAAAFDYVEKGFARQQICAVFPADSLATNEEGSQGERRSISELPSIIIGRGRFAAYRTKGKKYGLKRIARRKSPRKVRKKVRRDKL